MKGVILAGGKATRLRPLTLVTNKHLLPVYNKPMIFYPLEAMAKAGIKEVLIITGPDHAGSFLNLLRSGKDFGLKLSYEIQEEAGGLSQAVALAESFARGKRILVILGDNIFNHDLRNAVLEFEKQEKGAKVFGKKMPGMDSRHYGVIEVKDGKVVSIEEKPANPRSDIAQTGIYMYDDQAFGFISKLTPSARGELEITDLNNFYVDQGTMTFELMEDWWVDAGSSFDELLRANNLVAGELGNENTPEVEK
ncbi:MAG: spore coat protein [Candidatus Woykebacteria bacterium RIFCSPHIGHO2_12_FULL_43_10]|uniref:glucose-1-phosphate thymidylyltransferase n=2 Tax=Candidatus Woykeibacteriota TaxID=1817899 RepID=A0A1G1WVT5_9BACT|nr:MAG: spore coat protein [Candidatus Woykebacteria bacterium RIFCSPHIGHO2_02_FULL_43_16b]OGY30335.1 MAG: spore coat protein [Candidatus Woykebacteria bacterium RIFCSPHIGHO2_12_FULL_43_10]OGY31813.1 MAG: spore coat protein [Candidatus Woykebacteria bacterium RIFCSPLOWO2_01_FULL_43_14]